MPDVDFKALLSDSLDDFVRPPLFPVGNYSALVAGHEFGVSTRKETPYVRFNIKLVAPLEDVDQDLFEQAGGLEKLSGRSTLKLDFYLTPDARYRLRDFLADTLELNVSGKPPDAVIPQTTNLPLTVEVVHQKGEKEGEFWMNVNDHAKAV